jgi:phosphomannomutase/phosphoglucomutase
MRSIANIVFPDILCCYECLITRECVKVQIDPHIFREYDIRGVVGAQLSAETVTVVAKAIGTWFRRNGAVRIALGSDARESSPEFEKIVKRELTDSGCDVLSIGTVPTPLLYHTVYTRDVHGGVMITGSHNPPSHNGFKICLSKQTLFGAQIGEIREIANSGDFFYGSGSSDKIDVIDEYLDDLATRASLGERELKVVVDAGNGMGGVTAVDLYRRLGVEIIELFTDPDPTFPNHEPDPSIEANLADLIKAVRKNNADVGIAFDGDGDRLAIVDETGRIWWGDEILTLFARDLLSHEPGAMIIAEAKCSQTLFNDIERHSGVPLMWTAGHSIIKAKMQETGALLAGEMSGHFFFADRYYGFDDACYAGLRMLEILSRTDKPLSTLLADMPRMFSTPELRIPCPENKKLDVVHKLIEHYSPDQDVITVDGARIVFDNGWGIVRPSNTQALLILRFEADTKDHLEQIRTEIENKVIEFLN